MQYLVLRSCYVGEVYYTQGEVKELKPEVPIYEKNFQLLEAAHQSEEDQGAHADATRELLPGEFRCEKHGSIHRSNSDVGKRHLKHTA